MSDDRPLILLVQQEPKKDASPLRALIGLVVLLGLSFVIGEAVYSFVKDEFAPADDEAEEVEVKSAK